MMPKMTKWSFLLIVVVNGILLAGVAMNRSGTPQAQLHLTERELSLNLPDDEEENSGASLRLKLNQNLEEEHWFSASLLAQFGYDIQKLERLPHLYGSTILSRHGYAVLEFEGKTWEEYQQRQFQKLAQIAQKLADDKIDPNKAEEKQEQITKRLANASRLFPIDAGPDPEALRARYPDREHYTVVPVTIRPQRSSRGQQRWTEDYLDDRDLDEELLDFTATDNSAEKHDQEKIFGSIEGLLVRDLYLDKSFQSTLSSLLKDQRDRSCCCDEPPRFSAKVAWGKRYEPWVVDVTLLPEEGTP